MNTTQLIEANGVADATAEPANEPKAEPTAKPKSNSVVTTKWDTEKRTLTFTVLKVGELTLELGKVHQSNLDYAAIHGLKQRVSDAAAIPFDAKAKRYATPQEKYDAMKALVDHYNSGAAEWSLKRAERVGTDELMLTQALSELYPMQTADAVRAKVAGMTRAERTALSDHPKVKPVIERLRAAALATSGVDAEKLLEGFA